MNTFSRFISFLVGFIVLIAGVHVQAQVDAALPPSGLSETTSNSIEWRPGKVLNWRKWSVLIGQHGELIGGPHYNIGADILYTFPTERGIELHHSGPTWKGIFAHINHEGVIHVSEAAPKSDAPQPPRAEYGPWPGKSVDGSLRPLAKDEIIFPKEDGGALRAAKRPFKATGWVIPLVSGELYFPDHTIQPPAKALWIIRGKREIKLVERGTNGNDTWATIGSNLIVSSDRDSRWNQARWIYVDEQQRPVIPPAGTILRPGAHDANLITVMSEGGLFIPGTAIP